MIYLSVDPGNVTGVAHWNSNNPDVRPSTLEIPGGLYGLVDWWITEGQDWWQGVGQFFVEDFIIRPNTHKLTRQPAAYEALGWVKGWCHGNGHPCGVIGPSEHTPYSSYKVKRDSKIVRLGWSTWTPDLHEDAACSVLLMGLKRTNLGALAPLLERIATHV